MRVRREVEKVMEVQKITAQPFIVLTGKEADKTLKLAAGGGHHRDRDGDGHRPQLSKPPLAKGSKPKLAAVGGGVTPLVGDRKVEAMLGVKKPK